MKICSRKSVTVAQVETQQKCQCPQGREFCFLTSKQFEIRCLPANLTALPMMKSHTNNWLHQYLDPSNLLTLCFAEDCKWGSSWNPAPCTKICGSGTMTLRKTMVRNGTNGGKLCNDKDGSLTVPCNEHSCSIDKGKYLIYINNYLVFLGKLSFSSRDTLVLLVLYTIVIFLLISRLCLCYDSMDHLRQDLWGRKEKGYTICNTACSKWW